MFTDLQWSAAILLLEKGSNHSLLGSYDTQVHRNNRQKRRGRYSALQQVRAAAVEFPPYTIFKKGSIYDLRFFDPYPVIRMAYERRDEGVSLSKQFLNLSSLMPSDRVNTKKTELTKIGMPAGYIGLGAYFDGANEQGVRLKQTQPLVMRFNPGVRGSLLSNMSDHSGR